MKRLIVIVCLLFAPVTAHAQGGILLENGAATTIIVGPFLDGGDGVTTEESLTVTEWDLDICYSDATCDAITVTASGGSNDAAHVANGMYSLEIAAADADTNGDGHIIITHGTPATFVPVYHQIRIVPTAVFDTLTTDGFATVTGLWSELCSEDHGAGAVGESACEVENAKVITSGLAFAWPLGPFRDTDGALVTSGTPSCTRSTDAPNDTTALDGSTTISAVGAAGRSEIVLVAADTTATDYFILNCTLSGAVAWEGTFKVQP